MSLSTLDHSIREGLHEVEQKGADREEAAQLLERYAEAARNGYTQLPEDRGEWWKEVHGVNIDDAAASGD